MNKPLFKKNKFGDSRNGLNSLRVLTALAEDPNSIPSILLHLLAYTHIHISKYKISTVLKI